MAKLLSDLDETIWILKKQLLATVDKSKATELALFNRFGETDETIVALDELNDIAEQAVSRFSQLSNLQMRIAEAQPTVSPDMLELVTQAILSIQQRIPALEGSIEEIIIDWSLQ
jgi:hypothetical protein